MNIYRALNELIDNENTGALCTIISTKGSTPRHEGSKILVNEDGSFIGSVGGGEVEQRVLKEALDSMVDGRTRRLSYSLVDPARGDAGVCGGTVEVYVEPILPKPTLVVIGGGHVGKAVVHLAKWLGFYTVVSDDREEFCTVEQNPDADALYPVKMEELIHQLKFNVTTYVVLTTRGSNVDVDGLEPILHSRAGYIGVIGSRRRWLATKEGLINKGVPEELIKKVHSPIGLELNAETPEEIAVSILSEIIMLRNGGNGAQMKLEG